MLTDAAICVIIVISAICYARKGFVLSVISALSWLLSLAAGLFFCGPLKELILATPPGTEFEAGMIEKFRDAAVDSPAVSGLPEIARDTAEEAAENAATEAAVQLTGVIISVAAFILILIVIKIVLFLVAHLLSKKYMDGPIAWADGISGLWLGIVLGCIYSILILTALVPLMGALPESWADALRYSFDHSLFSGWLYDNNPLIKVFAS